MKSVEIVDDELIDDEVIEVVESKKSTPKKAAKKASKKKNKASGISKPVAVRIPNETLQAIQAQGIDLNAALKAFCDELVSSKTCPTCGQHFKKGKG